MSQLLSLRPYQRDAVDAVRAALARGMRRPAVDMATGLGKTVVFAHLGTEWLADNPGRRVLVLAHTGELLDQAMDKWRSVAPGLRLGRVQADANETLARVVVASVQTLRNERRRRMLRDVGLIIVDECFPAGTMIGDQRIEDLRPGDLVPSYDEETGERVARPVVATMNRRPGSLVRVRLASGEEFCCTANHPVMTPGGWCMAGLLRGESVLSFTHDTTDDMYAVRRGAYADGDPGTELEEVGAGVLRVRVRPRDAQGQGCRGTSEATGRMRRVRDRVRAGEPRSDLDLEAFGSDVLLGDLQGGGHRSGVVGAHGADESSPRLCAYEGEESDARRGDASQDGGDSERDPSRSARSRWQWSAHAGTAQAHGGDAGLAGRGVDSAGRWSAAVSLQGGHRPSFDDGGRRDRWGVALFAGAPRIGSSSRRAARWDRVVDVQVLQPGRDGTYGGVCRDGLVYNIEVAATHTYLIGSGIVAHNCHHAVAATYQDILTHFGALGEQRDDSAVAAGFTATMMRGDDLALGQVWQDVVYSHGIVEGIADGHLVRPRGIHVHVDDLDLGKVRVERGDWRAGDLGEALESSLAPTAIAKAVTEHADERRIIGFAPTVSSATVIADALRESGRAAGLVHGGMGKTERKAVLSDFSPGGGLQILMNCSLLTEGYDEPAADCALIARPTRSPVLYRQIAGRVLRPYPGKVDALLLDVVGVTANHSLISGVDLFGDKLEREVKEKTERDELELEDADDLADGQQAARRALEWSGPLASTEIDLFASSPMQWLRTRAGVFFLAAGERYLAIVPAAPQSQDQWMAHFGGAPIFLGYDVMAMDKSGGGLGRAIVSGVADLSYAMAWAEGDVSAGEKMTATKERAWRARPPTEKMSAFAARLGLTPAPHARMGEVSNMITLTLASRRIDPHIPAYMRGRS